MRLIDADELRELYDVHTFNRYNDYSFVIDTLDCMPTVDAVPKDAVFHMETFDPMYEEYAEEDLTLEEMLDKYTDEGYPHMEAEE